MAKSDRRNNRNKRDGQPVDLDAAEVDAAIDAFVAALARHRHFERETEPPRV